MREFFLTELPTNICNFQRWLKVKHESFVMTDLGVIALRICEKLCGFQFTLDDVFALLWLLLTMSCKWLKKRLSLWLTGIENALSWYRL